METNFKAKVKCNDEAKSHWMAPVFSYNYFSVNPPLRICDATLPGCATQSGMMPEKIKPLS